MKHRFIILGLLLAISYWLLAIYSFSQVDLNLTLSTNPTYQSFQKALTYLGYFNRPLSTAIYIFIVLLLAISYWLLAKAASKKTITSQQIWFLIILAVIVLLPSYPAFSHDIFNYLFDARIATRYHLSPWHYKALDFPADEWTRFMHWTHRPSVYPPIWIGLSLIPSLLGFGKFTLTLFWFKTLMAAAYLGSCRLIWQIAKNIQPFKPSSHLTILTLFAFNPLVLIESLVNAHMEIVMIFFGLLAIKLTLQNRKILKWCAYAASFGIKFMTAYLLPLVISDEKYLRPTIWLGMVATLGFMIWYGFQPWYILWLLPFALLLKSRWESQFLILASIAALFWNIPLIRFGDFALPPPSTRLVYVLIPLLIISFLGLGFRNFIKQNPSPNET